VVRVRAMTQPDLEAMLGLFDRVAEERLWIGTEPGYDRERYRANWERRLDDPRHLLLVAVDGDAIVGNLNVFPHEEYGYVLGMMVERERRRHGIGRALLEDAIAWARARNLDSLHLLVFPHNEGAIALYRACGFLEIERYENDVTRQDGSVWDTILMRLCLAKINLCETKSGLR
jgi:ribosomal protein S18 acetylase RimI-like enzyme